MKQSSKKNAVTWSMAAPSIYGALSSQPAAPLIHLHPPIHTKNTRRQRYKKLSLDNIPDIKNSKAVFYWLVTQYVEGQVTRWRTINPFYFTISKTTDLHVKPVTKKLPHFTLSAFKIDVTFALAFCMLVFGAKLVASTMCTTHGGYG